MTDASSESRSSSRGKRRPLNSAAIERLSRLVGHSDTTTTETGYRHQIRPMVQGGAAVVAAAASLPMERDPARGRFFYDFYILVLYMAYADIGVRVYGWDRSWR